MHLSADLISPGLDCFDGGGAVGALMRVYEWSTSPLGLPEAWPQPLKTLVEVMLASNQPIFVAWGPERTLLYNDPYAEILASKHPAALGRDFLDVWDEIRDDLLPIVEAAYDGRPSHGDDIAFVMMRKGYPEETHFAYSYTPVRDEKGRVAGFICPCHEITGQVLAARRQAFLLAFEERLRGLAEASAIMEAAVEMLGEHLGADRVGYGQVQADDATVRLLGCYANGVAPLYGDFPLDSFGAASIARQRRGETETCDDVQSDRAQDPAVWASINTRAFVSVPLVQDGRFRASLYVNSCEPRRWSALDVTLIEDVARRTWETVERARAEEAQRRNEARLAFLDRLGAETAVLAEADAVLATTTRLLGEHLGLSVCAYADMDEDQDGFTIRGDWAAPGAASIVGHYSLADFGTLAVRNLSSGLPLVVNDNLQELAPEEAATFQGIGIAATICMPLVKYGRLVALMAIHDRVPRNWTADDLSLLREVTARSWAHVERVGATMELRESEARLKVSLSRAERKAAELQGVLQSMPDAVYIGTAEGITLANQPALDQLGYASREELNRHVAILAEELNTRDAETGEPIASQDQAFSRAFGGERVVQDVRVRHRLTGQERVLRCAAAPVEIDGQVIAAVAVNTDVTERRHIEAALRELNDTLEQRVADRSAELVKAENALRQAQKMEAIGQLTGGVAHDFNNLLTVIKSSTDLLRRPNLTEERRLRYVNAISETVDRASRLTGQLLAFARRQALKPEVFDVSGRIRAVTDMLSTIMGSRVQLVTNFACEDAFVEADINQFETAVVNIAVNACDAMNGEGMLVIRVDASDAPAQQSHAGGEGLYVALSIADTGSGIPADRLSQIFEPFFTTKEVGKGTGLGLSQVYGFAKQSGGDVSVESEVGLGTTFTLYLPKVAAPVANLADEEVGQFRAEHGRGRRVLVVEDNREVGEFSTQLLQDLGYDTIWAANADEALACLDGGQAFDAVFSDVVMPGMSGVELGHEIRNRYPNLPVVLTSGYSHILAEESRHGFELLHKPYAVEALSRTLRRVMGQDFS